MLLIALMLLAALMLLTALNPGKRACSASVADFPTFLCFVI